MEEHPRLCYSLIEVLVRTSPRIDDLALENVRVIIFRRLNMNRVWLTIKLRYHWTFSLSRSPLASWSHNLILAFLPLGSPSIRFKT